MLKPLRLLRSKIHLSFQERLLFASMFYFILQKDYFLGERIKPRLKGEVDFAPQKTERFLHSFALQSVPVPPH